MITFNLLEMFILSSYNVYMSIFLGTEEVFHPPGYERTSILHIFMRNHYESALVEILMGLQVKSISATATSQLD